MTRAIKAKEPSNGKAEAYTHSSSESPMRPEVGTQPQFKKKKPPKTYRYDSSLSPQMEWDSEAEREQCEALIAEILNASSIESAKEAASKLRFRSQPFLNWTGKAERLSVDIPTLPLFIHERLSTKAIIETVKDKRRQGELFDPNHQSLKRPATEQVLKAYEHQDKWVNRMILGDSLVVMNSLLEYEGMAGKVQMIYMDPPYGVKFGSNFQPFVRRMDVKHNEDDSISREPEMVQAYRDTWELGLHSYLSYLRDRIKLSRELLNDRGSIFIQIGNENVHHVREILDEVFGPENFCAQIAISKTSGLAASLLQSTQDYLLWYAKDRTRIKYRQLYSSKVDRAEEDAHWQEDENGRMFTLSDLTAQNNNVESCLYEYKFKGQAFNLPRNRQWKTTKPGMDNLAKAGRIVIAGKSIRYKRYLDDFPCMALGDSWDDIGGSVQSRSDPKVYVVQTGTAIAARAMHMTTDPGDLVLDPTCGGGTTAYAAELWGRRWITVDVSRVPLALARQRLLTATFPYYKLSNEANGPAAGFIYETTDSKTNRIAGIVRRITLKSIATGELDPDVVLVDRPSVTKNVTRVTGPFVFEATIPTPVDYEDGPSEPKNSSEEFETFSDRMLEILRRSPILRLEGNHQIKLKDVRRPTKTLALSAEATALNGKEKRVAFLFGPETGAVSHASVYTAVQEAHMKGYEQLIVIGFAIEANARVTIQQCEEAIGIPAIYVQATPDLLMGDLLKTMRSSQIFSICGLPDVSIKKTKSKAKGAASTFQVTLDGLDTFDPSDMSIISRKADDVPAWFLDTDYNGLVFHVDQAFFPKTGAWENLKKSLKGVYDESTWDHLAGTESAPFECGKHKQIAVKVIDDRGNELIVVKPLGDDK
jgi:adenine-specific DNA-methyltransferase